jgi:hypothetical protein
MRGDHFRQWNWTRPNLIAFVFGLCLFGFGIGLLTANAADVSRVTSVTTSTTTVPTTTVRSAIPTTTALAPKPVEIGQSLVIQRMSATSTTLVPMTTTTTEAPKSPLEVAQAEVGKAGPYAEGGFWCAKVASYFAEQAEVPGFVSRDGPSALYADAVADGRFTDTPVTGGLVFIDLFGPGGVGHGQVTHVAILESVEGDVLTVIQGNGAPDPERRHPHDVSPWRRLRHRLRAIHGMRRGTCKFCEAPIEWLYIRFGNNAPRQYRWPPVSAEPDPEGRVVLWNGEWIKLRNTAPYKVEVERRRKLHGPRQCLVSNDKGES